MNGTNTKTEWISRSSIEEVFDEYDDERDNDGDAANQHEQASQDVRQQVDDHADENESDQEFHGLMLQRMRKLPTSEITTQAAMMLRVHSMIVMRILPRKLMKGPLPHCWC